MTPPVALTIAGSDSGGGAGIQADLKTFAALGVFGTSAITALTAQNTLGVQAVHVPPVEFLGDQLDAVLDDLGPAAVKTGMLATTGVVAAVAERARAGALPNLVVDPVMVAASGDRLLDEAAERAYLELLVPHAAVATPNLREAGVLLDRAVHDVEGMAAAAAELGARGAGAVVVKGGHLAGDVAVDVVWSAGEVWYLEAPAIPSANTHGTGCTFAAAVAAGLALGDPLPAALERAKRFVHRAVAGSVGWRLGSGHGPVDHFGWGP